MTRLPSDKPPVGFAALGLSEEVLGAITALGYEEPTPIQREAIPLLLEGRDLLGQAATGTGKTAAFALPMLQRIAAGERQRGETSALVLVPTRELAIQVAQAIHKYGRGLGVTVLPVYGGASMGLQVRALKRGVEVVVATPGRALDHLRGGTLSLDTARVVVLDEADEMLDMGFADDLEAILEATPEERQTALFSATMPPRIASIAERHLRDPARVKIAATRGAPGEMPRVRQTAYVVPRAHKPAALSRVLDIEGPKSALVFCRTRTEVDELVETLAARGCRAEALHGGMSQDVRERVMAKLRSGKTDLLIATDVAARGIDIEHLSHVVNYDVPSSPEAYVHRIGRTGRAGRAGVAITLVEPREHRLLRHIEGLTRQKIEVAAVPTVADLRARRLELLRASLRETILAGELDSVRVVVESLAQELDVLDIAAAAVKMLHAAQGGDALAEPDIPAPPPPPPVPSRRSGLRGRAEGPEPRGPARAPREPWSRSEGAATARAPGPKAAPRPEGWAGPPARGPARRPRGEEDVATTRIFVGAGRSAGMRPADLVGAITGEAGVESRVLGAIEIAEQFSLVEVPEALAGDIISALRSATIRGRRVTVRKDRGVR